MTDPRELIERVAMLEAEVAALRTDNARLRRLLDEGGAPDRLRHAFRDTVAMFRAVMHRTADNAADVEDYHAHLTGRFDAIVRTRTLTDAFGEGNLRMLVADALSVYLVQDGERARLDGPEVRLRSKAAQLIALALHELATNAVEHGPLSNAAGGVDVSWRIEPGEGTPTLVLTWKETGAQASLAPRRCGFGTIMLENVLAYELEAQSTLAYETDGLRCSLRIPFTDQFGRLLSIEQASDADDERS